ncbi:hypothetical protein ABZ916_39745 [Streptomyces sp. NPDC046853]|uniref:DUF6907 domain-containing protein n=1 Tax=Streptomyces sp. NPDC046853 TaxID=3154920 RepID=UPI0033CE2EF0
MSEYLPTFGPSLVNADEEREPAAVVRVAYALSREQLVTALGVSFAEVAADRDPAALSSADVRNEIEGFLAAQGFMAVNDQIERDALRPYPPEQQAVMQLLAAAVERAYPSAPEPPAVQAPRYADGMVTLQTLDHGAVTVVEPSWCTGHEGEPVGHRADITHNGPVVVARVETECHGTVEFLQTHLSWAPFAELRPEPYPVVAVEVGNGHDFGPEGVRRVAKALLGHAGRLHRFADDLESLRDGGAS